VTQGDMGRASAPATELTRPNTPEMSHHEQPNQPVSSTRAQPARTRTSGPNNVSQPPWGAGGHRYACEQLHWGKCEKTGCAPSLALLVEIELDGTHTAGFASRLSAGAAKCTAHGARRRAEPEKRGRRVRSITKRFKDVCGSGWIRRK
jgi:hypothetical protein